MFWLWALLPGLLAAIVTLVLTPLAVKLALRLRVLDVPGGRKQHSGDIPRLGGVAIFGGIAVSIMLSLVVFSGRPFRALEPLEISGFSAALLIIFALGLLDDFRGIGAYPKLLIQILAASIVVAIGWQISSLPVPGGERLDLGSLAPVLSVLWIVGVTNAVNLIDGLDGVAAGVVAIISTSLLALAVIQGNPETIVVTSCLAGACLGFLRHNWRPAKIYMGDSGSLTLGFVLASVTLHSSAKTSAALAILVPILALGLPLLDTALVMWHRFLRGHRLADRFASMFHGDRKHLHHLLLETHAERYKVMLTLYGLAVGFCAMALLVAASRSLLLGLAFLAVEFAVVVLIRRVGLNAEARRLADERLRRLQRIEGVVKEPPRPVETEPAVVREVEAAKSVGK